MSVRNVSRWKPLAGTVAGLALLAVWQPLSAWWIRAAKLAVLPLVPPGPVPGPPTASPMIVVAVAAIAALPLPARSRALGALGLVAATMAADAVVVLATAPFGMPGPATLTLGAVLQNAVALVWLLAMLPRTRPAT